MGSAVMLPVVVGSVDPTVGAFARTKAVVASCVVLVPTAAVGAVGIPAKAGDDIVWANAVVATCVVLVPRAAVGATGTPVNVGELNVPEVTVGELMAGAVMVAVVRVFPAIVVGRKPSAMVPALMLVAFW